MKIKIETILNSVSIVAFGVCVLLIALVEGIEIEVKFLAIGVIFSVILGVNNMIMSFFRERVSEEANRIAKDANELSKDIQRRQEEMEAIREIDNIFFLMK